MMLMTRQKPRPNGRTNKRKTWLNWSEILLMSTKEWFTAMASSTNLLRSSPSRLTMEPITRDANLKSAFSESKFLIHSQRSSRSERRKQNTIYCLNSARYLWIALTRKSLTTTTYCWPKRGEILTFWKSKQTARIRTTNLFRKRTLAQKSNMGSQFS